MTDKTKDGRLAEARRRAAILDRYLRIPLPTSVDDAAFAAELNLNVDRLLRLARVWKKHRSELLLAGSGTALASGAGAAIEEVLADEIDLSGVRPDRRAEVLRRIRVMQKHLAGGRPDREGAAAAAAEIGVSAKHFRTMLNNWLLHARAEAVAGATQQRIRWRRQPERASRNDLLQAMVAGADPTLSVRELHDDFIKACQVRGLKPLSLPRFYAIVQAMRKAAPARPASEIADASVRRASHEEGATISRSSSTGRTG